jgi:hypothetical protein
MMAGAAISVRPGIAFFSSCHASSSRASRYVGTCAGRVTGNDGRSCGWRCVARRKRAPLLRAVLNDERIGSGRPSALPAPVHLRDIETKTRGFEVHLLDSDDAKRVIIASIIERRMQKYWPNGRMGVVGKVRELVLPTGDLGPVEVEDKHIQRRRMPAESV